MCLLRDMYKNISRNKEEKRLKVKNINLEITAISIVIIFAIAISLIIAPEQSLNAIDGLFNFVSTVFGTPLLWFSLAATIICFYLALSRYGKITLGDGEPSYSLFSYIGMMICAGLASASVYFSFVEWIFFYTSPALGIEPMSPKQQNELRLTALVMGII